MLKKLKAGVEGAVIIAVGLFLLLHSLNIRNNPISYKSLANVFAQAKFIPIVMSSGVVVLGIVLVVKQLTGKDKSKKLTKQEWARLAGCVALVAAYLISITKYKFLVPTIIYSLVIMFFLNWKAKKWWYLLLMAGVAVVLGIFALPSLINLRLPK